MTSGKTTDPGDIRGYMPNRISNHFESFLFLAGDAFQGGIVLYDGEAILPLYKDAGILAVPLSKLWEL